ncbi:hypothetical protein Ciccas_007722 [Cichlidogyrus casuarinus]|uniref:Major facilitator superfamily (MFS) profile domain-containing protein n=1 Tax=Cichlidogyrus casuarinus TaxID=1844966 RepID=A0ABD2Q3F8_9PLAT
MLGDSIGRKKAGLIVSFAETCFGILAAFSTNFATYAVFRGIVGGAGIARVSIFSLLSIETTTCEHRSVFMSMWGLIQNCLARCFTSLLAYFLTNWRWLHAVQESFSLLFLLHICLLPESPRWLISKGRSEEALAVLRHGAAINRRFFGSPRTKLDVQEQIYLSIGTRLANEEKKRVVERTNRKFSLQEIVFSAKKVMLYILSPYKTRKVAKISFLSTGIFTGQVLIYYGLLYYTRFTRMSVYLVVMIGGLMSSVATVILVLAYRLFKSRKRPLMACYATTGVLVLISGIYTMVVQPDTDLVIIICGSLATIAMQTTLNMVYVFVHELFPTDIRSVAFGNAGALGRAGGAFCIFINQLDDSYHGIPLVVYGGVVVLLLIMLCLIDDTTGENLAESSTVIHKKEQNI